MKALIIGATGATGKDLVTQLLADDTYSEVHCFVRKPLALTHHKLHSHVVDFEHPEVWADLLHGDVAFSCLGTTLAVAGSKEANGVWITTISTPLPSSVKPMECLLLYSFRLQWQMRSLKCSTTV